MSAKPAGGGFLLREERTGGIAAVMGRWLRCGSGLDGS